MKQRSSVFHTRQYMLSRDYELYYYSDVNFRSVGSHSHDYYELYFFVEGAVEMELAGTRHRLSIGDVVLVPPGLSHRLWLLDGSVPYRRFVFWLSREYRAALFDRAEEYRYLFRPAEEAGQYVLHFDIITFNTLRSKLFALLDEIHSDRFGKQEQMLLGISDLMLHLSRLVYSQQNPAPGTERVSRYEAITGYIDTHLAQELTLESIAQAFYLSKYYIAHLFQQNTGLSVHQYITKQRLAACCRSIQAGTAISQAYAAWGFRDYSSFYRAFQRQYGMSPSAYRELHLQAAAPAEPDRQGGTPQPAAD